MTDPDLNPNPVPNALMTFSAPSLKFSDGVEFRKGFWGYVEDNNIWLQVITLTYLNEDVDGNGILDVGEDANNNGIFDEGEVSNKDGLLIPENVVRIPSSNTTDENGQTLINIFYAKQFGA